MYQINYVFEQSYNPGKYASKRERLPGMVELVYPFDIPKSFDSIRYIRSKESK